MASENRQRAEADSGEVHLMSGSASMKRTWLLAAMSGLVAIAVLGFLLAMGGGELHSKARKDWKNAAIQQIARRVGDAEKIKSEVLEIRRKLTESDGHSEEWFSNDLIVAANGDWIAFASKCSKEDKRIHDIFIGHGSDGKWYYSTFHFCVNMLSLRMEEQPADLSAFVKTYSLREFDGHSDDCLNKAWPADQR